MNSFSLSRRVITFRCGHAEPASLNVVQTEANVSDETISARCVRPAPAAAASRELEAAARRAWRELIGTLSGPRRGLFVEAGLVEQTIKRAARAADTECRTYLLAASRGALLSLGPCDDGGSCRPARFIHDPVTCEEVSGDLPVTFGPSAVLAMICHYLEVFDAGGMPPAWTRLNPRLSVFETSHSPYPPHSVPPPSGGGELVREVIVGGVPVRASKPAAVGAFLLHPERWCNPHAALFNDGVTNPLVRFEGAARPVARSLHVESLVPLTATAGVAEWEAELSLTDGDEAAAVGASPSLLRFDAASAVGGAHGRLGAAQPAVVHDPITGPIYGVAPALATAMRARDLSPAFS